MSGICFCTISEELKKKKITGTFMESDTLRLILHTRLHIQALKTPLNSKGKKVPGTNCFHCHFIDIKVLQANSQMANSTLRVSAGVQALSFQGKAGYDIMCLHTQPGES